MLTKTFLVLAVVALVPLACSSGAREGDAGLAGATGGAAATGVGGRRGVAGGGGAGGGGVAGTVGAAGVAGGTGAGGSGGVAGGGAGAGGGAAGAGGVNSGGAASGGGAIDAGTAGANGALDAGGSGAGAQDGGSDAGGTACGPNDDTALIVPAGLNVSLEQGGAGEFDLIGLTLREGPNGLLLDASLRNDGDLPACDAAFKVQLFDTNNQPLGDFINGLYTKDFYLYTLPDESTTIAACASPGDLAMTEIAITASDITLAEVGSVVYYYSYFVLYAVLIDGLTVSEVNSVTASAGTAYTGTVVNDLDTMVSGPSIAVFPLNCVGRPLGIAQGSDSSQVAPGGSWSFQTSTVDMPGVSYAAFPSASF